MNMRAILTPAAVGVAMLAGVGPVAGCGESGGAESSDDDGPTIVVTTTILGDIVENLAADQPEVDVLLPRGADPHESSLSVRQADTMAAADLVVVNGAGFEEGMADAIAAAEDAGAPVFAFADHMELLPLGGDDPHEGEADEESGEGEADEHEEGSGDPHIWTDPARMAPVVVDLGDELADLAGDPAAVRQRAEDYAAELEALDAEIEDILAPVPEEDRVLVTNHEVFGYFADRYDFEVVGAVIPSNTTLAEPSSAELDELAETIEREGVPAIFAESTQSTDLADALADSVGEVEVVTLFTESLDAKGSGAETYIDLLRTDAELVAGALT
jgi:zinc/manganese transport system substrate-binding protein